MAARFVIQQGTNTYRAYRWGFWALWVIVIIAAAFAFADVAQLSIGENTYNISLIRINKAIAFMIAILGLQVVVGFTGQVALGQSFFVGIGAYSAAYLVQDHNWPYLLTLVFIVPFCFVIGMLFGLPALRIRGLYLALVTLGLAAVFPALVQLDALFDITNGAGGKSVSARFHAPEWLPLDGVASIFRAIPFIGGWFGEGDLTSRQADRIWKYFLFSAIAAVCFWMVNNLVKSRSGRAIRAIRDNETGAAVSGVNLAMDKTLAFGTASALGGVAGMVYVAELGIASPSDFTQLLAINFIVGLVVGGVGTLSGAVVGGLVIALIPEWSASTTSLGPLPDRWLSGPTGAFILGVLLIALMFVMPGGAVAGFRKLKAKIVVVVPAPPGAGPSTATMASDQASDETVLEPSTVGGAPDPSGDTDDTTTTDKGEQ